MAEAPKFNLRNPAVKRIMQEIKEIKQDTSGDFLAEALETDIFEWHFVIRGPQDTEFDGGIYHGRILLPAEYPFKPPSFMMLTPNGRFETNVKICLSISSHHPEHWQPSWSVRTALTALIAFMPSPGAGALGALDFTKEERRVLAARSRLEAPRFGSAERQRVIDDMHGRMLVIAAAKEAERLAAKEAARSGQPGDSRPVPESQPEAVEAVAAPGEPSASSVAAATEGPGQPQGGSEQAAGAGQPEARGYDAASTTAAAAGAATAAVPGPAVTSAAPVSRGASESTAAVAANTAAAPQHQQQAQPQPVQRAPSTSAPSAAPAAAVPPAGPAMAPATAARWDAVAVAGAARGDPGVVAVGAGAATSTDHMLTALMWALYVGIGAILLRKVMGVMGVDLGELLQSLQQ